MQIKISLCIPSWPGTPYEDQAGFELTPASVRLRKDASQR